MPVRLASLDIAGTTLDEGGRVYAILRDAIEQATGTTVPDELLSAWSGTDKREAMVGILTGLGTDPARADAIFPDFAAALDASYAATPATVLPGVAEAIAALRAAGVLVALQTGYRRAVAEPLLDGAGWRVGEHIDALVTADEVTASRPAPYLVFRTMEATGVRDVAEVLTAGDTANDVLAGTSAGARYAIGVLTGAHTAVELGAARHTHLLPSVADIPGLLQRDGALPT